MEILVKPCVTGLICFQLDQRVTRLDSLTSTCVYMSGSQLRQKLHPMRLLWWRVAGDLRTPSSTPARTSWLVCCAPKESARKF